MIAAMIPALGQTSSRCAMSLRMHMMVARMTLLLEQVMQKCALIDDLRMSARLQAKLCWTVMPVWF